MSDLSGQTDQVFEDIQVGKYLTILRRRKAWIILTTTTVFVATLVVALRLPNVYRAETVILVDPQKVNESLVPSTGNASVADRLSTVRQEVMSPTRLKEVIEHTDFYAKEIAVDGEDAVVQKLQKSIQLEVVDAGSSRLSAFRIGYTGRTPEEAALIPNKLASMVIQTNVQARQDQSSGTAEFLQGELQDTKKLLEQKEAEMGRIKSTYIMDLPESKQYHLEALTNLRNQLQASQDRVNRDQQQKVYLQSMMASTNPTVDLDADSTGGSSPEEAQAQKLEARLTELRGRYGPGHPDVRKAQHELDQLRATIAADQKAATATVQPPRPTRRANHNPVVEAQINKLDQEVQEQTKSQKQIEEQISFHSSKLEREPIFEQQIAGLMRDYDTLRAHYNRLLDKKLSADMYTALVTREEGEKFVILDPAVVPAKPFGPNRFLYGLTALLGGLMAGIGLAVVVEMTDPAVRDEQEAANILGKSIIASIPVMETAQRTRLERIRAAAAMAAAIVSASALGFIISYFMRRLA
jgi:polysaccharide chain length determinant protein (PEP-CTERM system associated)